MKIWPHSQVVFILIKLLRMNPKTINRWIMYHQIKKMLEEGLGFAKIASVLNLDSRSVKKYSLLSETEFTLLQEAKEVRRKLLDDYELFVRDKLLYLPSVSSAQMHDWLKENYPQFPPTASRTVYNFVMGVRHKYQILVERKAREYFPVAELPYGAQGQADFGQYWLRSVQGRRKVHFFTMVLSRSRMKYVQFSERPYTTRTAIDAHEEAFRYFEGIPGELVYDQDRLFLVDENLGELLLTEDFKTYVSQRGYHLFFCRKGDPQSKGKIENVVKYVKQNFLYGRLFYDINTLQTEVLAWLTRTGNGMIHSTTKKIPSKIWQEEKKHLRSWVPITPVADWIMCTVLKTNVFNYQGNSYSVPQGTYCQSRSCVKIIVQADKVVIYDLADQLICEHVIPLGKGNSVINTDHKRDKSINIQQLLQQTAALFPNEQQGRGYLDQIHSDKPRYIRDQLLKIREILPNYDQTVIMVALEQCITHQLFDASAFERLLKGHQHSSKDNITYENPIKLLDPASLIKAQTRPKSSDINLYENIFNPSRSGNQ